MATAAPSKLMTTEEMLALPENGVDRELIRGELREKPVTIRNRRHSRTMSRIGGFLEHWLERQPEPRGEVLVGDAGFRLSRNPDTTVGIDLAYVSTELAASTPETVRVFDGVPVLAVEILSPSDQHEDVEDKIDIYIHAGVKLIWIVNPARRTVQVIREGGQPDLFNSQQDLRGEPFLPGFHVPVAKILQGPNEGEKPTLDRS